METHHIQVLDNTIVPADVTAVELTVCTMFTTLPDVVVSVLAQPMDMILGSDWLKCTNVSVTLHTSNHVTVAQAHGDDNGGHLVLCPHAEHSMELRDNIPIV